MYNKVLVIDDSKLDRFMAEHAIISNTFAKQVLAFPSGANALTYLCSIEDDKQQFPEVIFLDISMPVMDGFSFLDKYEQLPHDLKENCSVIMLSSSDTVEDFARIRKYPAVRKFLSKPLSREKLEMAQAP